MKVADNAAIAKCNAVVDLVDAGTANPAGCIRFYSGAVATNPSAEPTGLLAENDCANPAFGAAAMAGTADPNDQAEAVLNTCTNNAPTGTGAIASFAVLDRDRNVVFQGTVSTIAAGTGDLQLDDVNVVASGGPVDLTEASCKYIVPNTQA